MTTASCYFIDSIIGNKYADYRHILGIEAGLFAENQLFHQIKRQRRGERQQNDLRQIVACVVANQGNHQRVARINRHPTSHIAPKATLAAKHKSAMRFETDGNAKQDGHG